jgi:hypothetical protein
MRMKDNVSVAGLMRASPDLSRGTLSHLRVSRYASKHDIDGPKPICGCQRCRSDNWCTRVHGSVPTSARLKSRSKQQWSQQPWLKRYRSQSIALRAGISPLFANTAKSARAKAARDGLGYAVKGTHDAALFWPTRLMLSLLLLG